MNIEHEDGLPETIQIDENLLPVDRLKAYVHSELLLRRLFVVRDLPDTLVTIGFESAVENILPAIKILSADTESIIRQCLMQQIPVLCQDFIEMGGDEGYSHVKSTLFEYIVSSLTDPTDTVRAFAQAALLKVLTFIQEVHLEECTSPIFEQILTEEVPEEIRMEILNIINPISRTLGPEMCSKSIVPLLIKLSDDKPFRVRRMCATCYGAVFDVVGADAAPPALLNSFLDLCKDDIWGVRKGCLESFMDVSKNVDAAELQDVVAPMFSHLLEDRSSWVRQDGQKNLGFFLHLYGSTISNEDEMFKKLFDDYITIPKSENSGNAQIQEIEFHRAYCMPALISVLGPEKWEIIKDFYLELSNSLQWKVRRTLAHSLHEVAQTLGPDITKEHLLPVFDVFLGDIDEVKVGLVKGFSSFLSCLNGDMAEEFIQRFSKAIVAENVNNWRYRSLVASQIIELSDLVDTSTIQNHLCDLALKLAIDEVEPVRTLAYESISELLAKLMKKEDPSVGENYIKQVSEELSSTETSYGRQGYIRLCSHVARVCETKCFEKYFMKSLLELADHRIPNVRLSLARMLNNLKKIEAYENNNEIKETLEQLGKDPVEDVAYLAKNQGQ